MSPSGGPPPSSPPLRIRFAEFLLDEAAGTLYRSGEQTPVEPKPLALILLLAQRRPQLVGFDEIQRLIWPGVTVDRSARDRVISQARRAVGDDGERQRVIRTHRGRGLCFAAPVVDAASEERSASVPPAIGDDAPLVGRERVIEALTEDLERLRAGRGGSVLLEGEAGIGKTRIAREIGARARASGLAVHWSRAAADGEDAGPGWIWRQLLQSLSRESAPARTSYALEMLRSSIPDRAPGATVAEGPGEGEVRARLADTLIDLLTTACAERPRLLILDDLHAADAESLRLVRLLVPLFESLPALWVMTWREGGAHSGGVAATRRALDRARGRRIRLAGLSRDEVGVLLGSTLEAATSDAEVTALHDRTGGNPFFVTEIVRARMDPPRGVTREAPAPLEIPASLARVLEERLAGIHPSTRAVLEWAAVCAPEPEPRVVARAGGIDERDVEPRLLELLQAGLLERSGPGGRLRFAHGLLAEHLRDPADPQLARRHWAVAEVLESLYGDRAERWGEIARHRRLGLSAGSAGVALDAASRAARRAMELHAHDEAATLWADALDAAMQDPATTPLLRAALLLDLGRAQRRANRREAAANAFDEAGAIARRLAAWPLLARAALGYAGLPSTLAGDHKAQLERVQEALGRLDERELGLRARLLGRQAALRAARGDTEAAQGLAQQAVTLARRLGDPPTLGSTLRARNAVLVGDVLRSGERIAYADETLAHAERNADDTLMLDARLHRAVALLHDADVHGFRAEMNGTLARARELGHPLLEYYGSLAGVTARALDGRLDEAERLAVTAHAIGVRADHPDRDLHLAIQIAQLRFLQGRLGELADGLEEVARRSPLLGLQAALALAHAETDRQRRAGTLLSRLVESFVTAPRDAGWLGHVSLLALVAWRVGDAASAERLAGLLEPYADKTVSVFLVSCNGSARYFLGLLAQVRGRHAEARAHLDAACDTNETMGARPWWARSLLALAETLGETGDERDRTTALVLLRRAREEAERLGLRPTLRAARELATRLTALGYEVDPSE